MIFASFLKGYPCCNLSATPNATLRRNIHYLNHFLLGGATQIEEESTQIDPEAPTQAYRQEENLGDDELATQVDPEAPTQV
jgi:hypothetical protein